MGGTIVAIVEVISWLILPVLIFTLFAIVLIPFIKGHNETKKRQEAWLAPRFPGHDHVQIGYISKYQAETDIGLITVADGSSVEFSGDALKDACPPILGRFVEFIKDGQAAIAVSYNRPFFYDLHKSFRPKSIKSTVICPHCGHKMTPRVKLAYGTCTGSVCPFCLGNYQAPRYLGLKGDQYKLGEGTRVEPRL
ncbi:hypothetical protein [Sutterella wadsworthensis]|uniref:hypothetical protein n=1 Tax=Sutterella wadsworthensis TaxID=40545 RepID=UPI0013F5E5F8|nr:hypothetical protein [Sutterella wadsworthensis]